MVAGSIIHPRALQHKPCVVHYWVKLAGTCLFNGSLTTDPSTIFSLTCQIKRCHSHVMLCLQIRPDFPVAKPISCVWRTVRRAAYPVPGRAEQEVA
jgi:hypothetical protein